MSNNKNKLNVKNNKWNSSETTCENTHSRKRKFVLTLLSFFVGIIAHAQTQAELLEQAYREKSNDLLEQFFTIWRNEIPTISEIEFSNLNDTLKQAYNVFAVFYKACNVDAEYLMVQNEMDIVITDTLYCIEKQEFSVKFFYKTNSFTRIKDFRPKINCEDKKPVYMSEEYRNILNDFLQKNDNMYLSDPLAPRVVGRESKRQWFLDKSLLISSHLSGYRFPYPRATGLTFDKNMQYAKIDYAWGYSGGYIFLKNKNGEWEIILDERTWIE